MKIGDLIGIREFPAVVTSDDVRSLRAQPSSDATHEFVTGYLGFDERSRHALGSAVRSLANAERGGGYFVSGAFGSGKSHLLGLLALLADGAAHEAFALTQPHLAGCLDAFGARLCVSFSLDDYDATRFSLEEVFWRELRAQWAARGLPPQALPADASGARSEAFSALDEALLAHGRRGLVVCIDEVSLFLAGRPEMARHRALQADAAFLQFLGQRARRAPLWVFAALQKNIEDIGEIEAYSLSQIRDRFTNLPLSLAHLPSLIERRLILRRDPEGLRRCSQEGFAALERALPRLDFGISEWESLFPFHPATVALLEQVVVRFLSRTRSAALFCLQSIDLDGDAQRRVLPRDLFDYIAGELEKHPELRALDAVRTAWESELDELARDASEREALSALMQALLLFKIAGATPSVLQLANAVALDARLPGDGNYQYAQVLLEKLRTRGSDRGSGAPRRRFRRPLHHRPGYARRRDGAPPHLQFLAGPASGRCPRHRRAMPPSVVATKLCLWPPSRRRVRTWCSGAMRRADWRWAFGRPGSTSNNWPTASLCSVSRAWPKMPCCCWRRPSKLPPQPVAN